MKQQWRDLLFLHWPIEASELRTLVPDELELDLYDGKAWLAIVPFDMKGVTARGCPAPSALCNFPEINLRTYVTCNGKPGVWFFSLDVSSSPAVWAARTFFHLPYFKAEVSCSCTDGNILYDHDRKRPAFRARYRPIESFTPEPDSFEHWSTARYCLYCQSRKGRLYRGNIHHAPWPLQKAEVEIYENTFFETFEVGEMHPSILFSKSLDVVVYPLESV